jgi:hypothetical protein
MNILLLFNNNLLIRPIGFVEKLYFLTKKADFMLFFSPGYWVLTNIILYECPLLLPIL